MVQIADKRKGKERPDRPTIRRSPDYKAKLSAASDLLAAKVVRIPELSKEKRQALSVKNFNDRRSRLVEEDFDIAE